MVEYLNGKKQGQKIEVVEDKTLAADATSVTFSGLSLDSVRGYLVVIDLKTDSTGIISLTCNSDTTAANYDSQFGKFDGATVSASRDTDSRNFAGVSANTCFSCVYLITKDVNGNVRFQQLGSSDNETASLRLTYRTIVWQSSAANLTGFTITHAIADAFLSGSRFTLYELVV
jgi:hypothetical protein